MKNFKTFIVLIILTAFNSFGVSGQQKPAWLMPLYFEDATGAKDTVYIGYDSTASAAESDIDTVFDEGWIKVDTSKFNAFIWIYPGYAPVGNYVITSDSVRKKDISRWPYPNAEIGFIKGKMPIILKWEDSLLNSPSLPFEDISPRPRARIDFYCGNGEPGYYNCPIEGHLTLTGYPTPDLQNICTDIVVFNGSGTYIPSDVLFNIYAFVVPHNYQTIANSTIIQTQDIDVYPNPFNSYINIANPNNEHLEICLINTIGQLIYFTKNADSLLTIDLKNLKGGIYIIRITSSKSTYFKKVLKLN
jgi:hypothetical protein